MGLSALRHVSLKQAREYATRWRSILREDNNPVKECDKQKRRAMRYL
ncbi:hypothetical protein [Bartonella rattaustraliani]|nr:hypothetical protein [Bartonella rattaustraliani]